VSIPSPRPDQVVLTDPGGARLCNSLACTQAGTLAEVIATYGVLNDPGASLSARGALWRECRSRSYPLCGGCWEQSRQVAISYRPALAIIDSTAAPAAVESSGGRFDRP
jgi:hypothetical protein